MTNGEIRAYDIGREWLNRDVTMAYKLNQSHVVKVLTDRAVRELTTSATTSLSLSDGTGTESPHGYDMGLHATYYYHDDGEAILLTTHGDRNFTLNGVQPLITLIQAILTENPICSHCGQTDANLMHPSSGNMILRLFCSIPCFDLAATLVSDSTRLATNLSETLRTTLAFRLLDTHATPLLSSFSVATALLLLYVGSGNGRACHALEQFLALPHTTDEKQTVLAYLRESAEQIRAEQAIRFTSDNMLLYRDTQRVSDSFGQRTHNLLTLVRFGSPVEALAKANAWCSEKTHGLIAACLTPDDVTVDTTAILLNTVYLKARWQATFTKRNTETGEFTRSDTTVISLPLMYQQWRFEYCADATTQYIKLYYTDETAQTPSAYYMFIALPRPGERVTLTSVVSAAPRAEAYTEKKVRLTLPQFEQHTRLDLVAPLASLGLAVLFGDESDVSDVLVDTSLKVSKVIHDVVVRVNELGTEAAAVTAVVMRESMMAPPRKQEEEIIVFDAIRTFYYAIVDGARDDRLLFSGIYDGR